MEKYTSSCRLILIAESLSKVIDPIRSRCLPIRVGSPTETEIINVLQSISQKESIKLPDKTAYQIALSSNRNLRRAILMLEATKVSQYPFSEDPKISLPDWELFIDNIANEIIKEQTPQVLIKLYIEINTNKRFIISTFSKLYTSIYNNENNNTTFNTKIR